MKKSPQKINIDPKWIEFLEEDYRVVIKLFEDKTDFYRSICFHAQQFIEKTLKGIIESNGLIPPKTHDIEYLANRIRDLGYDVPMTLDDLQFLSSIYFDTRYPPDIGLLPEGEPTKEDARRSYTITKQIRKWIEQNQSV
jgi:HEPN domain-containing protein